MPTSDITTSNHIQLPFQNRSGFSTGFFEKGRTLPLVIEPHDAQASLKTHIAHLQQDKAWLREQLTRFGAFLLRGFPTKTTDDLQALLEGMEVAMMPYVGGVGLRGEPIQSMIYKSTNFPAHLDLHVHNEAMYHNDYPRTIIFYCLVPSDTGGATPLADSRNVYQKVRPDIRQRFETKQLTYIRYLPNGEGQFLTGWPAIFADKEAVAAHCLKNKIDYRWLQDDILELRQVMPAVLPHRISNTPCWVNQATIFHQSFWSRYMGVIEAGLADEYYPTNVAYGDGSPIDEADIQHIEACWASEYRAFPWQQGDVLFVDNELVAHGRYAFSGKREVQVVLSPE